MLDNVRPPTWDKPIRTKPFIHHRGLYFGLISAFLIILLYFNVRRSVMYYDNMLVAKSLP